MSEWRCSFCKRILAKHDAKPGSVIEIKCRCNTVNVLKVT